MKNRNKQAGMTILEGFVSGGIMVGVIIMSFEVMATGVQVSKKAINESEANEASRTILERFVHDVNMSEAIVARKLVGFVPIESNKDYLVLRQPVFNADGTVRPNESTYITYYQDPFGKKDKFWRMETQQINNGFTMPKFELLHENVNKVDFKYTRQETLNFDPVSNAFPMPGSDDTADTNGFPDIGKLKVDALRIGWTGKSYESAKDIKKDPNISISGTQIRVVGMGPGTSIGVKFYLHPKWKLNPAKEEAFANSVHLKLKAHSDDDDDDETGTSDLKTSATCKN